MLRLRPALAGDCCAPRPLTHTFFEEKPVSLSTFTTNGLARPVSFAAFRAYLETERPALVKTLVHELTAQVPNYRTRVEDAPEQQVEQTIDAYLAGLDDPAQLLAWTKRQLGPVLTQTIELNHMLQIAALYRQQFIQIGLRALGHGVEGAAEGLGKLMELLDLRLQLFVQFYTAYEVEQALKRQAIELQTFYALAENAQDGVLVTSTAGEISYANGAMRALLGFDDNQLLGTQILAHIDAPQATLEGRAAEMDASGSWRGSLNYRRRDGSIVACKAASFLIQTGDSAVVASIVRDLIEEQLAEQERLVLQDQVIAVQQAALRELSTPLIPLADHVVAMPLIGSIDSARAQQIIEELLAGVVANRATTAIIDITGVLIVDTQVAGALLRAAQAVELLGSRVVITGIRPEVAQTLVGIGVNLGSIVTRATLQDGIAYALRKN
jgi:PAS domain S-box-containing protein